MQVINVLVAPFIAPGPNNQERTDLEAPIQLPNNVTIQQLDYAEEISKACLHKGFNFDEEPYRLLDSFYCLTSPVNAAEQAAGRMEWDSDQSIGMALAWSRLVRPNAISSYYAGRVYLSDGGKLERIVPFPGPRAFVVAVNSAPQRHWLSRAEWQEVGRMIDVFSASLARNCERIVTAFWYVQRAFIESNIGLRWLLLTTAIESLIGQDWLIRTKKRRRGEQFRLGLQRISDVVGAPISDKDANEAWKVRSQLIHRQSTPPLKNPVITSTPLYVRIESSVLSFIRSAIECDSLAENMTSESALEAWF